MSVFCSRAITLIIHIRHVGLHYLYLYVVSLYLYVVSRTLYVVEFALLPIFIAYCLN